MEEGDSPSDIKYCSNCKKDIPSVNYVMHSSHCSRNIELCEICEEPVPISGKDEHFEENHSKVKCDCGGSFEKMNLENHKEQDCIYRNVVCQYCELELRFCEMKSHKDFCGSRTELCEKCKKYVQHKNFEEHLNSDCLNARQNNAVLPNRHHERNRIPPEVLIQNVNLGDGFGFDTETLQRLLRVAEGTLPDENDDTRATNTYGTLHGICNEFPQPRQDILARGHTNSDSRQNRTRRNRNDYDLDDEVDSDDVIRKYQCEEDELMAALLACGPNSFESPSYPPHDQTALEQDKDGTQESALDQTVLPCEFCGEAIELDQLILHQTGCQLTSMAAAMPTGQYPNLRSPPRSLPPLHRHLLNNDVERYISPDGHDETLLPCEFCEELVSTDMLFAHQSICDPQRTRPSSVLQAEYFYHNEPNTPSTNNDRPRASNRPPRPNRPVVSERGRQNNEFDFALSSATATSVSSRNNRSRTNVGGSHRPSRRAVPRETRDVPVSTNDSLFTTSANNIASARTRQVYNYTSPATEKDDSYEVALFRRETSGLQEECFELADKTKSEKYISEQEAEYEKISKSSSVTNRKYSNGIKAGRGHDMGVLKPSQGSSHSSKYRSTGSLADKTTKTSSHRNKTPSASVTKNQSSKELFKHTQDSRKRLTRLAPSCDVKPQSSSDRREQRINRSVERGLNERRGSTERKDSSEEKSTAGDKKSKKKFA